MSDKPQPARIIASIRWGWVIAALILAGCGSSSSSAPSTVTSTKTVTTPQTTSSTASTTATKPAAPNCVTLVNRNAQGSCTISGIPLMLANRGSTATIKSLSARIVGVRTADSVSTSTGAVSSTAHGLFVIVTLAVKNRLDSPQQFGGIGGDQTSLVLSSRQYSESFDAENQADQQSFVSKSEPIQPGETVTGDVVYDVPPSATKGLVSGTSSKGAVLIANFGDDIASARSGAILRIGAG